MGWRNAGFFTFGQLNSFIRKLCYRSLLPKHVPKEADWTSTETVETHASVSLNTECHDSELVKVTIYSKDYGNEDLQMAIHQNLVIGDSFYDIQRMKSQYPQLTNILSNNFNLKDDKAFLGTDCFSASRLLDL